MILYVLAAAVAIYCIFKWTRAKQEDLETLSKYFLDKNWSFKDINGTDQSIRKFKIEISDQALEDLNRRLDITRFPVKALPTSKFHYGIRDDFMKEIMSYWRNDYSWRKQEKMMNTYNHFKTTIEGLDIHFIHSKPDNPLNIIKPNVILVIHGWPGSFVEYLKALPLFTHPMDSGGNETDSFIVVCPSIPGFGFSDAPQKEGFNAFECARIFHKLMLRLEYKNYYVAGGDYGSLISNCLAIMYPSCINGCYVTMSSGTPNIFGIFKSILAAYMPTPFFHKEEKKKLFPLKNMFEDIFLETGYFHLQATKPDTVGFALSDSPVGMAAYIIEKFASWTNLNGRDSEDGLLKTHWTFDQLLNNVMIYWWSGNISSSLRFYKENFGKAVLYKSRSVKVHVPAGYGWFPDEFVATCKQWVQSKYSNLIHFTYMKKGGHFQAYEVPHDTVKDIRLFVRKVKEFRREESSYEIEEANRIKMSLLDRYEK